MRKARVRVRILSSALRSTSMPESCLRFTFKQDVIHQFGNSWVNLAQRFKSLNSKCMEPFLKALQRKYPQSNHYP